MEADRLVRTVARHVPSRSWAVKLDALRRPPRAEPPPPKSLTPPPGPSPMEKLIADYRRALPDRVRGIADALRAGNTATLARLAHQLRGSAAMFGFPEVSEAAGRLEDACRAGQPAENVAALVEKLAGLCPKGG